MYAAPTNARRRHLALAIAFALVATTGCGGPEDTADSAREQPSETADASSGTSDAKPERGDWLVLSLLSDPENLNPLTSSDRSASNVLGWIFPALLTQDNETRELRPLIAKALPDISEDKLSYTFRLRDDVTYSDGQPVTARDVLFTLKAVKNPVVRAPHYRNYLNSVKAAVALDDHTVRIELRERYFLNDRVLGGVSPMPRHYYDPDGLLEGISVAELDAFDELDEERKARATAFAEQFNTDYQRRPLGPGAFYLKNPEQDVITGERIMLHRRADYWAPDDPSSGDAWVERVLFRIINDTEAALVEFKGSKLDRIGLQPLQHERPDTNNARFKAHAEKKIHVSPGYTYIGWNQKRQLFADVRVRRALGYFVDKDSMIEEILRTLGVPVEGPIFVERPEYKKDLPAHTFDPARGRALLAEAGWSDSDGDGWLDKLVDGVRTPLRVEIISNSGNPTRKSVGLTVIDEMKRAGIDASFREMDWSIMLEKVKVFDYDAVILGWAMSVNTPDLFQIWHSTQAVEGGSNHVFYKNPRVDELLEAYRVEFDAAKRKVMYDEVQQILYDEQPYTFLFMQRAISAWDRRFMGVTWYPSGATDMAEWWVPQTGQRYSSS
jgi:peptide/nickel transport system substrate-binding protein